MTSLTPSTSATWPHGSSAVIYGNGGDDTINVGGDGDVTVFGGVGADTIDVSADHASILGGLGADDITVDTTGAAAGGDDVTVYGGNGINDAGDEGDTIAVTIDDGQTAHVYGNAGDDTITLDGAAVNRMSSAARATTRSTST